MVVNSSITAQDAATTLQEMLQASSKQNSSTKSATTSANAAEELPNPAAPTTSATQSSHVFSPLDMLTGVGSGMSGADAEQLTQLLSLSISGDSTKAQAAQSNQIPQSVLNLLQ